MAAVSHQAKSLVNIWKHPQVSERMWSVNLAASISAEYQAVGGPSGPPSE